MTLEAPDPKAFSSWEEAFQYPIPAVRGMEKQLRRDVDSNREKLRTLVGASYRDLLSTAESIISMDVHMHDVETYMGDIGRSCNTKILDRKGSNFKAWTREAGAPNSARHAFASQLAVLRSCPNVISRLLKSGGSVLVAAKILVIARLLHTKLTQRLNPPPYLEILRTRIGNLRRKLLGKINRHFKHLDTTRDVLVEAMCAFSLATSSSAKDVQRHFYHTRLEAISEMMKEGGAGYANMLLVLRLYTGTLRDVQTIMLNTLPHALETLKFEPLLNTKDVYDVMDLNLDVHRSRMDDSIKTFTPYVRHDDISKVDAERSRRRWAQEAFRLFLGGLRDNLGDEQDPLALMYFRRQILELWLSNQKQSLGIQSAAALDELRVLFNLQMTRIIRGRASQLGNVSAIVQETFHKRLPGKSDVAPSLWDSSMIATEISHGGTSFREKLTARSLGTTEALENVTHEYLSFLSSIKVIEDMINSSREIKWADDLDDEDEDDLLENKQVLLSEDDPRLLQDELEKVLNEAYTGLQKALCGLHSDVSDDARGWKSGFLVRTWREIRQHLPQSYSNSSLAFSLIPQLQDDIVDRVLDSPLERCSKRLDKISRAGSLSARPLWEGTPELPVLPSPWSFRLLIDLTASMTARGSDIWSPQSTNRLKKELSFRLAPLIIDFWTIEAKKVNDHRSGSIPDGQESQQSEEIPKKPEVEAESEEVDQSPQPHQILQEAPVETPVNGYPSNGDNHHDQSNPQSNDIKIQTLFDVNYLINAASVKDLVAADSDLVSFQHKLIAELALEAKSVERMKKDAGDYWKRTSLLFGLLA